MNSTLRIAAAFAVALLTTAAEARPRQTHYQIPGWIDAAAVPAYPLAQPNNRYRAARRHVAHRRAAARLDANGNRGRKTHSRAANDQSMRIDKAQEYVKPNSPNEKLVAREAHEKIAGLLRNGMVRVKTVQGFWITVNPVDTAKFLKFFALLKENNHKVNPAIVGCYSPGGHKRGSNHHIGRACDIQTGWNRAPAYMYHVGKLIRRAGLYDGCSFGDCGHVEAVRGLFNRKPNLYAALAKFQSDQSTAAYQP